MEKTMECPRCNGKGQIKEYGHVQSGICFKCNGTGKVAYRKPTASKSNSNPETEKIMMAKFEKAKEIYQNDKRMRVGKEHPYFFAHAMELAKLDKVWDTL